MCNECWKEFKGWLRSFTKTEVFLAILEFILLIICIAFIVILIMHLIVCQSPCDDDNKQPKTDAPPHSSTTDRWSTTAGWSTTHGKSTTTSHQHPHTGHNTLGPGTTCTWEPSKKTTAATHYYDVEKRSTESTTHDVAPSTWPGVTGAPADVDGLAYDDHSDGEEPADPQRGAVLALVRTAPPGRVTFGCVLTALSAHWVVTAASCIEAIEETDSLDNFVMVEGYGGQTPARAQSVSDVQLHPLWAGANRSYDVAALRCARPLARTAPVRLPSLLDYYLLTLGERFTVLGFGPYRSMQSTPGPERAAHVYRVPAEACAGAGAGAGGGWAARHLSRGREERRGSCGAGAVCAGPLYARGEPCNYCAGTPLLRGRTLLGVMAAAEHCGVACEPALYVNVAVVRDWLEMIIEPD